MIPRDTWRIIETILRRYPAKKKEYQDYIDEVMSYRSAFGTVDLSDSSSEDYTKPQSVTEAAALKMTYAYADRIKKEIEAVEFVYGNLRQEEQKVIRMRYWAGGKKPVKYQMLADAGFSERHMKRIVYKTITQIGKYLGEIR